MDNRALLQEPWSVDVADLGYNWPADGINRPWFNVIDSATVDGDIWQTVEVSSTVAKWLRTQDPMLWYEKSAYVATFDIHYKIQTLMVLKFT